MIDSIDYPTYPLEAGDSFSITVLAAEPILLKIKCFVTRPPPPSYRACAECGSISVQSGDPAHFSVSQNAFASAGGFLEVMVVDGDGDKRRVRLAVKEREEDQDSVMTEAGYA